jgi:hypothetical protein
VIILREILSRDVTSFGTVGFVLIFTFAQNLFIVRKAAEKDVQSVQSCEMETNVSTFSRKLYWCVSILIGTDIGQVNGPLEFFLVFIFICLAAVLLMSMLVARMNDTQQNKKEFEDFKWRTARARNMQIIQKEHDLLKIS